MCDKLITRLERSFDRNELFYIGLLSDRRGHEEMAETLGERLIIKGISTRYCRLFNEESAVPHEYLFQMLNQIESQENPIVLIAWCLEHVPDVVLKRTFGWFNSHREWLLSRPTAPTYQRPVPTVLIMSRVFYRDRFSREANHLRDCAPVPFDL